MFILRKNRKRDFKSIENEMKKGFVELEGELEIFGVEGGKTVHYDKGRNTVTVWAKHALMHLLSAEAYSTHGNQRLFDVDDATAHTATSSGEGTNKDGTLMSGQQYFSSNATPDFNINARWIRNTITPDQNLGDLSNSEAAMKYPFFPSKMLFGTGIEFTNWAQLTSSFADYKASYESSGWNQATFDSNISNSANYYSNEYGGSALTKKRSMNDIYSGALTTPVLTDLSFGLSGAIKDGEYASSSVSRHILNGGGSGNGTIRTYDEGGNEFLKKEFAGVGNPCFIYARRDYRFFQTGSEVQLSADSYLENKITLTAVMPEQTGADAGIFYPYNGYTLKTAGLFCDARMLLMNTVPTMSVYDHENELANYNKLIGGIMYATRYISPITKTHSMSISVRWTLYL